MTSLADIQAKLVAAQNSHPAAVQTLIAEALDCLDDVARHPVLTGYLEGVNTISLSEALTFLGVRAEGQEAIASDLAVNVNNLTRAALNCKDLLRAAQPARRPTDVLVDGLALRQILVALNGPAHHIGELQATRSLHRLGHANAIETLMEQFNSQAQS